MRFPTSLAISVCLHGTAVSILAACSWFGPTQDVSLAVAQGQPRTITLVLPSAAAERQAVELPPEPVLLPPPSPPELAPAALEVRPTRDVAPLLAAREPQPTPPDPSRSRADLTRTAAAEQPVNSHREAPLPRTETLPERSPVQAVALPLQSAPQAGARVDQLPRKLPDNPPPPYPPDALLAGIEGRVLIRVSVRSDGRVDEAQVADSSGSRSLDEAALSAVRRWRFQPARRAGRAVAYDVVVPVRFSINRG